MADVLNQGRAGPSAIVFPELVTGDASGAVPDEREGIDEGLDASERREQPFRHLRARALIFVLDVLTSN